MHRFACLALIALCGCSPGRSDPAEPVVEVVIAFDAVFESAARSFEERYELDRPGVDVMLVPDDDDADVTLVTGESPGVQLERRIAVIVPAETNLRLIDLSRGTCDIIVGRAGTPLGEMGRQTLQERGLDDRINPRLLESDDDDLIDWAIERDAIGLTFLAQAGARGADVRVVAEGVSRPYAIVAGSAEGTAFVDWLLSGVTTRTPLREHGFDLLDDRMPLAPGSD